MYNGHFGNGHFGRKYQSFWWWTSGHFGHKSNGYFGLTTIILVKNNGHFRTGQRSFWKTVAILVKIPKVGVELVINQLVKFSVSFLPVSDLPLSNQPLS